MGSHLSALLAWDRGLFSESDRWLQKLQPSPHRVVQRPRKGFSSQESLFKEAETLVSPGGSSVKRLTLDSGSGHDPTVCGVESYIGLCVHSTEPAWDSLSLYFSLSLCPFPCSLSLSTK